MKNEKIILYLLVIFVIAIVSFSLSSVFKMQDKPFHIHADFKVYINGKFMDFADEKYYEKSHFLHLDESENKEKASGVLHMHAKNIPLGIFFDSIGFKFNKTCFETDSHSFCNNQDNNIKFYVNNQSNNEFENYVFKDSDKILISYGSVNEDIQEQLESITNYSGER